MSLSFNKSFYSRSPKLGYQFKCEFRIGYINYDEPYKVHYYEHNEYVPRVLSTCVQQVTIPSIKIKSTPYVGMLLYNPTEYDFSDMSLKIVFEENDDMIVNKFLTNLLLMQRPTIKSENRLEYAFLNNSYSNTFIATKDRYEFVDFLDIKVFEMNPNKNNGNNYKSSLIHVFKNCYVIKNENVNMEYTESPKGVSMEIEFGFKQYYIANVDTPSSFTVKVSKGLADEEENKKQDFEDELKNMSKKNYPKQNPNRVTGEGEGTKNFDMTDFEFENLYKEVVKSIPNLDEDVFRDSLEENADNFRGAFKRFNEILNEMGMRVDVVDFNNGENSAHSPNVSSIYGSHFGNDKGDLGIYIGDSRYNAEGQVKPGETMFTQEVADKLHAAADKAGLILNFEINGNSLWIDAVSKSFIRIKENGEAERVNAQRWVKKNEYAKPKKDENGKQVYDDRGRKVYEHIAITAGN